MKLYVVSRGVCYAEALSGAASLPLVIELIIYDHVAVQSRPILAQTSDCVSKPVLLLRRRMNASVCSSAGWG